MKKEAGRTRGWSAIFRRLRPYLWDRQPASGKAAMGFAFAATLGGKMTAVASPFFLGAAVNRLAQDADPAEQAAWMIVALVAGYGLFRTLGGALPYFRDFLFAGVAQRAERWASVDAIAHVHALSMRFHENRSTGSLSRVMERGARSVDFLMRFLVYTIVPTVIEVILGVAALSGVLSPWFGVILLVSVGGYTWFTIAYTNVRVRHRRTMNEADQSASGRAVDGILNADTVKAFTAEAFETARYDEKAEAYERAAAKTSRSLALLNMAQGAIVNAGLLATALLSAHLIMEGRMQVGDLTTALLLMIGLYQPLAILGFAYREIRQSFVDLEALFDLLDEEPEVRDAPGALALKNPEGAVAFENVSFGYDARRAVLKGVDFAVAPGRSLAVVGPTGAGKSTIARLLFRFYDVGAGRVCVDGRDVRELTQNSLRRAIGVVPQEATLFNDTIAWNIRYGRPEASEAEVREAARRAALIPFIESLPDGWDTLVGERGVKLSGGEKQRVAVARALLKDPPILILDEATSALDSATEAEIQTALDEAARGRTVIAVAHRLSTIAKFDRILVLDEGRVREEGDHDALLAAGGLYAALWRRQSETAQVR